MPVNKLYSAVAEIHKTAAGHSGTLQPLENSPFLSGDATDEEIEFLKRLKFKERRPAPLYYYRELQNLRDPLHFRTPGKPKELH